MSIKKRIRAAIDCLVHGKANERGEFDAELACKQLSEELAEHKLYIANMYELICGLYKKQDVYAMYGEQSLTSGNKLN